MCSNGFVSTIIVIICYIFRELWLWWSRLYWVCNAPALYLDDILLKEILHFGVTFSDWEAIGFVPQHSFHLFYNVSETFIQMICWSILLDRVSWKSKFLVWVREWWIPKVDMPLMIKDEEMFWLSFWNSFHLLREGSMVMLVVWYKKCLV